MHPIDLSLLPLTSRVNANGRVDVGGVDLLAIARDFGTPLFVYDVEHLRDNMARARDIFGDGVAYATKAFLCKSLARLAYDSGMSLDVSTAGEYHVARAAGVPAGKLVLHGNNKPRQELERAVTEGAQWIVLDSFDDINLAAEVAAELRQTARVMVRVNAGVEVHTHNFLATGNEEPKFGFPLWTGDAEAVVDKGRQTQWLQFLGLHIHVGSLVFAIGTFLSALDSVLDFVLATDPEVFVVGGGLGVRYLETDTAPSLEEWGGAILKRCQEAGVRARVLAEPGRSIVAATAVTLYTVGSVALKDRTTYVAVDGGMSDNPHPPLYPTAYPTSL